MENQIVMHHEMELYSGLWGFQVLAFVSLEIGVCGSRFSVLSRGFTMDPCDWTPAVARKHDFLVVWN